MGGVKRTRIDEVDRPTLFLCQYFCQYPRQGPAEIYEDLIDYEEQEEGKGEVKGTRIAEDNEKESSSKEGRRVKGEEERSRRWVTSNKGDLQQDQWTSGPVVDQ